MSKKCVDCGREMNQTNPLGYAYREDGVFIWYCKNPLRFNCEVKELPLSLEDLYRIEIEAVNRT